MVHGTQPDGDRDGEHRRQRRPVAANGAKAAVALLVRCCRNQESVFRYETGQSNTADDDSQYYVRLYRQFRQFW